MALIGTLTSGVSALRSFGQGLEVIGNNIANINTTGYKTSQANYAESFTNALKGAASGQAGQVGTGVQVSGLSTSFTQGALNSTGVTTDLGISGSGFFVLRDAAADLKYATRDGSFRVDADGYLTTPSGLRVQGLTGGTASAAPATVGDIKIGASLPSGTQLHSVSIDRAGNVIESYSDGTTATTNRVQLQNFKDTSALVRDGTNLFSNLTGAGPSGGGILSGSNDPGADGLGAVVSGSLESSNVDLTTQFSDLITTQRSFQAGSRLITISDSVLEDVVNLKR
jgi:flagellar hook protein FlgE